MLCFIMFKSFFNSRRDREYTIPDVDLGVARNNRYACAVEEYYAMITRNDYIICDYVARLQYSLYLHIGEKVSRLNLPRKR